MSLQAHKLDNTPNLIINFAQTEQRIEQVLSYNIQDNNFLLSSIKIINIPHKSKKLQSPNKTHKKIKEYPQDEPLLTLRDIAVETGIKDLAENHDHYLYGVSK